MIDSIVMGRGGCGVRMASSPENGPCRDKAQGYTFRGHFEPLRQMSIQKGVLHSVHIVNCEVRATLWTLGQREEGSKWTSRLWNLVITAILVPALSIPGSE